MGWNMLFLCSWAGLGLLDYGGALASYGAPTDTEMRLALYMLYKVMVFTG